MGAETERTLTLLDTQRNVVRHVAREGAYLGSDDEVVSGVPGGVVTRSIRRWRRHGLQIACRDLPGASMSPKIRRRRPGERND
jgi:hypothetical protein